MFSKNTTTTTATLAAAHVADLNNTKHKKEVLTKVVVGAVILVVAGVVFGVAGYYLRWCFKERKAKEISPV